MRLRVWTLIGIGGMVAGGHQGSDLGVAIRQAIGLICAAGTLLWLAYRRTSSLIEVAFLTSIAVVITADAGEVHSPLIYCQEVR